MNSLANGFVLMVQGFASFLEMIRKFEEQPGYWVSVISVFMESKSFELLIYFRQAFYELLYEILFTLNTLNYYLPAVCLSPCKLLIVMHNEPNKNSSSKLKSIKKHIAS